MAAARKFEKNEQEFVKIAFLVCRVMAKCAKASLAAEHSKWESRVHLVQQLARAIAIQARSC